MGRTPLRPGGGAAAPPPTGPRRHSRATTSTRRSCSTPRWRSCPPSSPTDRATSPALRPLAAHLRRTFEALPRTPPHYGLCHGDLHKRNVLFGDDDGPSILDWDCAGYGRAYDVAVLLWSTALQGLGTGLWDA